MSSSTLLLSTTIEGTVGGTTAIATTFATALILTSGASFATTVMRVMVVSRITYEGVVIFLRGKLCPPGEELFQDEQLCT